MSPVIILGLVLMWAVVLVPMWLRRHDEAEETRSVDRFSAAMHTLSRRAAKVPADRYVVMPNRSKSVDVHVSGASAPEPRLPRQRTMAPRTAAQRRRRTLLGLLATAMLLLIVAVFTSSLMAWVLEVLVDATLVAFVVSLRKMAIAASTSRRGRPVAARRVVTDSAAPRRQQTTAERQQQRRWEYARADVGGYDEQVTVHYGEPEPATAQYAQPQYAQPQYAQPQYAQPQYAEPQYRPAAFEEPVVAREREFEADPRTAVFDQTAFAPFEEPVVATAADGFFDQDAYNEPQPEPVVEAPVAEQVMPEPEPERPAAGFIETGVVRGRRDAAAPQRATRKAPAPKPAAQRTAAAAASPPVVEAPIEPVSPVGGSPWEPVPVPRPTYTMKPPAPPRRRRYDAEEPLLPPVEPVPELDAADELEEILDRRWAVND